MMQYLNLHKSFSDINSEKNLIIIFNDLIDKGLDPFEAYDYLYHKLTEERIIQFTRNKNSTFIEIVRKAKIEFLNKRKKIINKYI